jgi:hypothetical protein
MVCCVAQKLHCLVGTWRLDDFASALKRCSSIALPFQAVEAFHTTLDNDLETGTTRSIIELHESELSLTPISFCFYPTTHREPLADQRYPAVSAPQNPGNSRPAAYTTAVRRDKALSISTSFCSSRRDNGRTFVLSDSRTIGPSDDRSERRLRSAGAKPTLRRRWKLVHNPPLLKIVHRATHRNVGECVALTNKENTVPKVPFQDFNGLL